MSRLRVAARLQLVVSAPEHATVESSASKSPLRAVARNASSWSVPGGKSVFQRRRARRTGTDRGRHPPRRPLGPVPDDVWEQAARHYDESQLAGLVLAIAAINAWNRINATTRQITGEWVKQLVEPTAA